MSSDYCYATISVKHLVESTILPMVNRDELAGCIAIFLD